jgi:hypothetical protein
VPPPPRAPTTSRPTLPLIRIAAVVAIGGFFVAPVLGPSVAALLAAVGLQQLRREPGRWNGESTARAVLIGSFALGILPALALTAIAWRQDGQPLWMLAVGIYAAAVLTIALSGAAPAEKGRTGLSTVGLGALIFVAVIGIAVLLVLVLQWFFVLVVTEIFHSIGKSLGCSSG